MLRINDEAPNFTAETSRGTIHFHEWIGNGWVILFSHPKDFTPVRKYATSGEPPDDEGWTGAEIEECCRKAYRLKISLQEAAQYIVPVSRSASEEIKSLRLQASGKFISASAPGVYQYEEAAVPKAVKRVFREMTA